jgi:hypothetical protein
VSHFLNFEFLNHSDPHDRIKDLEKGFRKGVGQHDGMNVNKQLFVGSLYSISMDNINRETRVYYENHGVISAK